MPYLCRRLLRAAPDGLLVRKALSACTTGFTEKARQIGFLGVEVPEAGTRTGPRRGRPARRLDFYAAIACRFEELESESVSTSRRSVRRILAEENLVHGRVPPITTVAEWLRAARRLGYLTPTTRGRRHSEATADARTIAERHGWRSGLPVRTARTR